MSTDDKKEACKTFIEQTKLLVSLASAFIVAPAAVQAILRITIDYNFIIAEIAFISSVLAGYIVLGSITGTQFKGEYNVYRRSAMLGGLFQFFSYLLGLVLFLLWLVNGSSSGR